MAQSFIDDVCDCDQWWATLGLSVAYNGSSWPPLWPLGNRMVQTAWIYPSGGLCQPQSQQQKGSLGVGVCGLTTIHH